MTVNTKGSVFWDMMPCNGGRFGGRCCVADQIQDIYPEDGECRFVRNTGSSLLEVMMSRPRKTMLLALFLTLFCIYLFINYMFYCLSLFILLSLYSCR